MRTGEAVLCVILCAAPNAWGAFERPGNGPRLAALGGTGAGLPADLWGALANPAASAGLREMHFGWAVSPGTFGFSELKRQRAAACIPWGSLALPISASQYGFDLYRESIFSAGVGASLAQSLRAGMLVHCYYLAIRGYGSAWSMGLDAGFQWDPLDCLTVGCTATNIHAPTIGSSNETLPRTMSAGVDYRPVPDGHLLLDLVKDVRFPTELHIGVEYSLLDLVALRWGMVDDPSLITGGLGIHWEMLDVDYALTVHAVLGETHEFGLRVRIGEK